MKEAWIHLEECSKEMVTAAIEGGADALIMPPGCQEQAKSLGRITTVAEDGDLKPGTDVFFETLLSPEDEARIALLLHRGPVVVQDVPSAASKPGEKCRERAWEVIPLENLVAHGGRVLVPVYSPEDVDLAMGILEKGVTGVVVHARNPEDLKRILARAKISAEKEVLRTATVKSIRPAGLGDRVCVDTCTLMKEGDGMLVGNSSGFFFHVQAEALENPYVAPRPFRVNAGPVHAYARVPGGRTRYLSELQAGDPVLIVQAGGAAESATVGRVKIERRPLLLIEASSGDHSGGVLLQNAETIRLSKPDGTALSVVELKPGDAVLVAVETMGRHFGLKVEETIWEK